MDRRAFIKGIAGAVAAGIAAPYIPINQLMKLVPQPKYLQANIIEKIIAEDLARAIAIQVDHAVINGNNMVGYELGAVYDLPVFAVGGIVPRADFIDVARELKKHDIWAGVRYTGIQEQPEIGAARVYTKIKIL